MIFLFNIVSFCWVFFGLFGNKICYCVSLELLCNAEMGRGQSSLGNWTLEETLLFEVLVSPRTSVACTEIC